ncbi:hypothetical protein FHG87_007896 [Trinorchestia longiramus]|nr:hypothetical protein FHG87_007896 [Trinorchestia longiramus]
MEPLNATALKLFQNNNNPSSKIIIPMHDYPSASHYIGDKEEEEAGGGDGARTRSVVQFSCLRRDVSDGDDHSASFLFYCLPINIVNVSERNGGICVFHVLNKTAIKDFLLCFFNSSSIIMKNFNWRPNFYALCP